MKLRRIIGTLVMSAALALAVVGPAAAHTPTGCIAASKTNHQMWVGRDISQVSGNYFDLVRGNVRIQDLDPCVGDGLTDGKGSFVLAANLQTTGTGVVQLGYGQFGTSNPLKFYWVNGNGGQANTATWAENPAIGHTYTLSIEKTASNTIKYIVSDLTDGSQQSYTASNSWLSFSLAWWGYETLDTQSQHGVTTGENPNRLHYMGYSTDTVSSWSYRSSLTSGDIAKNWVDANHYGAIGTLNVTGDTFNGYTNP